MAPLQEHQELADQAPNSQWRGREGAALPSITVLPLPAGLSLNTFCGGYLTSGFVEGWPGARIKTTDHVGGCRSSGAEPAQGSSTGGPAFLHLSPFLSPWF